MVTDQQQASWDTVPVRDWVILAEVARITSRHGALWRACVDCGLFAPLDPDAQRCQPCEPEQT
jgi:hypothetical protein